MDERKGHTGILSDKEETRNKKNFAYGKLLRSNQEMSPGNHNKTKEENGHTGFIHARNLGSRRHLSIVNRHKN